MIGKPDHHARSARDLRDSRATEKAAGATLGLRRPRVPASRARPSGYFCHASDSDPTLQLGIGACNPSLIHKNWPLTEAASLLIKLMIRSAAFSGSSPPVFSTQSAHCTKGSARGPTRWAFARISAHMSVLTSPG